MIRLGMAFFWITAFLGASPSVIPIGIKLHNPGNIRSENIHIWKGAVGIDRWGHLRFRTDMDGLRAMSKILRAYHRRYGINTVSGIANRWVARPRNRQQGWQRRLPIRPLCFILETRNFFMLTQQFPWGTRRHYVGLACEDVDGDHESQRACDRG